MSKINTIRNLTKPQLINLKQKHKSKTKILEGLGVNARDPRARRLLIQKITQFGLSDQFTYLREYTDEEVVRAVNTSSCISDVLDKISLTKHGNNYKTIRNIINRLNLDISHFDSNKARVTSARKNNWTVETIFCENSKYGRGNLRDKVLEHGVIEYKCFDCGNIGEWRNKPLRLQVDHINGINNDNRIENLRFACHNCHSQTPTFGT